jgi:hypothetical protein
MGRLDLYAKDIFASETTAVTRGGVLWLPPSELNLTELRLDGRLFVRDPARLVGLAAPWSEAQGHEEIVLETKMQGDHLDMRAIERGVLRRQARQVQRMEGMDDVPEDKALNVPRDGDIPLWMTASHVPAVLRQRRVLHPVGPGCYRIETGSFQFLWIAANELPLLDELVPFLIARSGRRLDEFGRWIQERRPPEWLSRMVELLPMSIAVHEELLRFVLMKTEDPEIKARQKLIAKVYVDMTPEVKAEMKAEVKAEVEAEVKAKVKAEVIAEVTDEILEDGRQEGLVTEARSMLRRVLSRRKLALSAEDEARIDACADLPTLERWFDRAIEANTASEALQ